MAKKILQFIQGIIVEVYDLLLTERKDDRFGRVVTTASITEDDLIRIAAGRHTDITPATMKAALQVINDEFLAALLSGASIKYGYFLVSLKVNGVFIGDHPQWDAKQHSLSLQITPTSELREAVRSANVQVRGLAQSGTFINSVFDAVSGAENSTLTAGGGATITGSKIRIVGDHPDNGIYLTNLATQAVVKVAETAIVGNDPSKIVFVVPADLASGDYRLSITTQFSSSAQLLKEPRSCVLDYALSV